MKQKLIVALALALLLLPATTVLAQDQTPPDLVREFLTALGYKVLDVGLWVDDQGNPDPNVAAAEVEMSQTATAGDRVQAAAYCFLALRKAYPNATALLGLVKVGSLVYIIPTEAAVFDQLIAKQITAEQYANYLSPKIRVFDLVKGAYVTPGTPGGSNTPNKTQTNKDFGGGTQNQNPTCSVAANLVWFWLRNGYMGKEMDFTIGGGEWGTHDYKIPGTNEWKYIEMPPGKYTWSAHIAGVGTAHGERTDYLAGTCAYQTLAP